MMRLRRPRPLLSRPTVSVVIPCYNYGNYLPDAVRSSTVHQPDVDVEVLIVDDASPDGSGDVARRLAKDDPRVSVLQHEQNMGHLQTYNDGLTQAGGQYVVLLSADDMLAQGSLGRAVALMQHDPSVGFVYGLTDKFHGQPKTTSSRVRSWGVWSGREWYDGRLRSGTNPILSPEVVMRRDLLAALGYYDLNLPHTADLYTWMRAAQRMNVGRVNGPTQAHYRMHEQQMHWIKIGWVNDLRERLDCLLRAIDDDPDAAQRTDQCRELARQAVAREALTFAMQAYDRKREEEMPVAELADLAREIWPGVTDTRAWRTYSVTASRARRPVWRSGARAVRTARKGVLWLRRRRYGV
jgi:glycosyltransferase involved in cell wall biosynthesis